MMATAIFIDLENMGSNQALVAIRSVIYEYKPSIVVTAYSNTYQTPKAFYYDLMEWENLLCNPGPDAADKILQSKMRLIANNNHIDTFILVTNDSGFEKICKYILQKPHRRLLLVCHHHSNLFRIVCRSIHPNGRFSVLRYLTKTFYPVGTIFIPKSNGEICEVPFINGMHLTQFVTELKNMGLYRKHIRKWLPSAYISIGKGDRLFINNSVLWAKDINEHLFECLG